MIFWHDVLFRKRKETSRQGGGEGRKKRREEGRKREKENKVREAIAESDVSFMI